MAKLCFSLGYKYPKVGRWPFVLTDVWGIPSISELIEWVLASSVHDAILYIHVMTD